MRLKKRKKKGLTKRQIEIMKYISKDYSNKEIARELKISIKTVETHLTRIYGSLDVDGRIGAVVKFLTGRYKKS